MSDTDTKISAEEIVYLLRSDDEDERRKGLDALDSGGNGNGMALVIVAKGGQHANVMVSSRAMPHPLFQGLLYLSQSVGAALSLELNWVSTKPIGSGLIVP